MNSPKRSSEFPRSHFSVVVCVPIFSLIENHSSGGAGKLTVEKLEDSISQLKEMFRERATLIENMASTPGAAGTNTGLFCQHPYLHFLLASARQKPVDNRA